MVYATRLLAMPLVVRHQTNASMETAFNARSIQIVHLETNAVRVASVSNALKTVIVVTVNLAETVSVFPVHLAVLQEIVSVQDVVAPMESNALRSKLVFSVLHQKNAV